MAAATSRYLPGPWAGVVRSGAWLLAHNAPHDSLVERLWLALEQPEPETEPVLADLVRASDAVADGGFVFVHRTEQATHVVVCGQGIAELIDADGRFLLFRHEEAGGSTASVLPGGFTAVRLRSALFAADRADTASLPVDGAVVLASVIEHTSQSAEARQEGAPQGFEVAREAGATQGVAAAQDAGDPQNIEMTQSPEPRTQAPAQETAEPNGERMTGQGGSPNRGDDGYLDDFMEPGHGARARGQVLEAADLDWMSSSSDEPLGTQAPVVQAPIEPVPVVQAPFEPAPTGPAYFIAEPAPAYPAPHDAPQPQPQPQPQPSAYDEPTVQVPMPTGVPAAVAEAFAGMRAEPQSGQPQDQFQPQPLSQESQPLPQSGFGVTDQPLVTAFWCPYGHLTPAHAPQCRVCGAQVAPQQAFSVVRPSLGRLRLSNGEVYPLDRDAVFGRRPEIAAGRPGPQPNAIALTDDRDVSRNHLEIRLDGWRVLAVDLGSMNGTRLAWPNLAPQELPPGTVQEIVPGCALILAPDVWIYFEAAA